MRQLIQGILKGGKYHCTVDLLFDWFVLVCFANNKKILSAVIQLIPNQSNRRSTVQRYFPPTDTNISLGQCTVQGAKISTDSDTVACVFRNESALNYDSAN
jgi:hypothetical protein